MLRNLIALVAGVLISFLLTVAGAKLTFLLVVGNVDYTQNKDAIVTLMLLHQLVIIPGVSIAVGGLVAAITLHSFWWLGGIAVLPLFIYGFVRNGSYLRIGSLLVYVLLAFIAAFVVSRLRRTRTA